MIPAITDFLRRLPLGDPFVDSFSDPLVVGFHKLFLLIFVVAMAVQLRWLSKRSSMDAVEAQD